MDDSSIMVPGMVHDIKSFLSLWPSRRQFAEKAGFDVEQVHKWAQSGRIPARHLNKCLQTASACGFSVSAEDLIRISAKDAA